MAESRPTMWILRADYGEPRMLRLPPGAIRTVGRGRRSDFVMPDPMMSRVHCRLVASEAELVIEDLGSTNGTFVNGGRVETIALEEGDRLRIGRSEFTVVRDVVTPAESPRG